jgi:hypothetical protein
MQAVQPVQVCVRTTSEYRSRHCVLSAEDAIAGEYRQEVAGG